LGVKNQLKTFFQDVRFVPSAPPFLSDPLGTICVEGKRKERKVRIPAYQISVGDFVVNRGIVVSRENVECDTVVEYDDGARYRYEDEDFVRLYTNSDD
jgi:hypothetical protein